MAKSANFLAVDVGAESGRCFVGRFSGENLFIKEIHRFPNGPVHLSNHLYWNVFQIFSEIKNGISCAVKETDCCLNGFGLDTWGVDFAFLDRNNELLGMPYHYRDQQTEGMLEEAFRRVSRREIYWQTGIQFMRLNSLYQLLALNIRESPLLTASHTLVMIPDLLNYWLTGNKSCEYTNATTTQCMDAGTRQWAWSLLDRLGIPRHIFPEIIQPGTELGTLLPHVVEETGASDVPVVAVATHDNASAVASIPRTSDAWLSAGTWCVVGIELEEPIINELTFESNITNEGGICGAISMFKNVVGLWLIQECRRTWAANGKNLSYVEIGKLAARAKPFSAIIDPDAPEFLNPGDMPARIREWCIRSGQTAPEDEGAVARTIYESLALKYRWIFERLEKVRGRRLETLQIIGGGSQNRLLNQFVANALDRPVISGPTEATTVGNMLIQMLALNYISSLDEGRELIQRSFQTETFLPEEPQEWDEPYSKLQSLLGSTLIG